MHVYDHVIILNASEETGRYLIILPVHNWLLFQRINSDVISHMAIRLVTVCVC